MEKTTINTVNSGNALSGNPVHRRVEMAGAALHGSIDRVADPARNTVERLSTAAHETVDKLASNATHVAERFSEQTRRLSDAPVRAVDYSKSWIQERPLEAVGAALAIGFILGRLTAR